METIDREIAEKREQLQNAKGTETEIYTRIVGYYRSLKNWNIGKRDEYLRRVPFAPDDDWELGERQSGVEDYETCESCQ